MSTELNKETTIDIPVIDPRVEGKFYIFSAEWNKEVVGKLLEGCHKTLLAADVKEERIVSCKVPGSVELVNAAATAIERGDAAAIVILGCVVRGDTPHFDYVCQIVSQATAILNSKGKAPVIFGLLTVENLQQAFDRAGGILGNKGEEAAVAALNMATLHQFL